MPIQTATTGNLAEAQRIAINQTRFTMEHSMPCVKLVEHFTLKQGEKQLTVPKAGQMTAQDLVDGVDLVDNEDIGMTTVDLTTAEVGLKVIITDKLARQENEDVFKIVGRQMGDAMGRKKDEDVIALFSALNGGTTFGADGSSLTLTLLSGCIANAKAKKYPAPIMVVHHPNAIYAVLTSTTLGPGATYPLPKGFSEELLGDFFKFTLNHVTVFEDGNVPKVAGVDSGYGAIFSKNAMCTIDSLAPRVERERDISLRATEVVLSADYGVFEIDDGYGAPMQYEIGDVSTT